MKQLPKLPAERALKIISGRWKPPLLYFLLLEPRRLAELQRLIPEVTQKVLMQQLRELEAHGLVGRRAMSGTSRPEYFATPLSEELSPLLTALCAWGQLHQAALGDGRPISATGGDRVII